MRVLKTLLPEAELAAVEINPIACQTLRELGFVNEIYEGSLLDFIPRHQYDLVLIRGVLIHINPSELSRVYKLLHHAAHRYICIAEYYNPSPVEIPYRGESGLLYKRDFAGELLDTFPDLRLVDYGFIYRRDPMFPQDDITWFLLEKARP